MELTDLLTFSAVARTGGITRAAEELNTVQSNVTQRVKALEAEIGSMETTAAVRLPALLAGFHRRFPAVRLSLRTATTADLVAAVLDGILDGAFVAGPIEHADLASTVAFREELVLVTARHIKSLKELRAATQQSGPTALVFRTGRCCRARWWAATTASASTRSIRRKRRWRRCSSRAGPRMTTARCAVSSRASTARTRTSRPDAVSA